MYNISKIFIQLKKIIHNINSSDAIIGKLNKSYDN